MKGLGITTGLGLTTALPYYMGHQMSRQNVENTTRGAANAAMAQYWQNMPAWQRYGAALMPQLAASRMQTMMGPEFQQYYQQRQQNIPVQ